MPFQIQWDEWESLSQSSWYFYVLLVSSSSFTHTYARTAFSYRWCRGETATHWYVGFSNKFLPFLHNWCQAPIPILSDVRAGARGYSPLCCVWILYSNLLDKSCRNICKIHGGKQTEADRRTSTVSHKCTLIGRFKGYAALHART